MHFSGGHNKINYEALRMAYYCGVYNCYNISKNSDLSFYKYPKDPKLQWFVSSRFLNAIIVF